MKKHEAFEADLAEHRDRVATTCETGTGLIRAGNYQADSIAAASKKLQAMLKVRSTSM